ncbi:hypothetical protein CHLRE_03g185800v5 [Chlamydomonas reinhardtii]|uniref:Uncharacterized protein n=1 Tax=Chlamydomonas reinhardtii TaxID=3055 RepID=A0A2K3DXZ6_CHLRE|nr:uncharacterized protein CHLRE_03g185800v5 [Chlamydomonas reinhardtii]PNW85424.1 hypothetical protein CHLRE_03g185800v5 [Chlamydomonas reinhardtii]
MLVTGLVLAACAAVTHTCIDTLRKYASTTWGISNDGLVTVPALLDAVFSVSWVVLSGHWQSISTVKHPQVFATATLSSSLLLLLSRFMYQRAVCMSPLSLTIPYLAFTPAILIVTAYIFLGELPGSSGVAGVCVVALGGYLLNLRAASASSSSSSAGAAGLKSSGDSGSASSFGTLAAGSAAAASGGGLQLLGGPGAGATAAAAFTATSTSTAAATGLLMQRAAPSALAVAGGGAGGGGGGAGLDLESGPVSNGAAGGSGGSGAGVFGGGVRRLLGGKHLGLVRRPSSVSDLVARPTWSSGTGALAAVLPWHQEPGTVLMIGVAVIWSITASLDKLGVLTGPSIWMYFAVQRLTIGGASLMYICATEPRLLLLLRDNLGVMIAVSALELAAVLLFLNAVRHLLVSYVVAIKRCNVLMSVLLGAALFRESIRSRLPYIFLMMLGVMLIVLEPSGFSITHSHNRLAD